MRRAVGQGWEASGAGGVEALGKVEDPSEGGVEAPGRGPDRGADVELAIFRPCLFFRTTGFGRTTFFTEKKC